MTQAAHYGIYRSGENLFTAINSTHLGGAVMPRLLLTAGFVCAVTGLTGWATAQNASMPGTVVSNTTGEQMKLVGNELPQVAKPVGRPVNLPDDNPLLRRYDPNNPYDSFRGTNLSVKSVVAPVNGASTAVEPNMFQQISKSVKSILGLSTLPSSPRIYTPGIYRRDRERVRERMFVRD